MPHIKTDVPLALPTRPPVAVASSRALTAADHAARLEVSSSITLTVPDTLPDGFEVAVDVLPGATVTVAVSGSATINGSTTSVTRSLPFALWRRVAAAAHTVTGV